MTRTGTSYLRWIIVGAVAAAFIGSSAGAAQSIDSTDEYPAPPEAIVGAQQAVLSIANVAASTCHATLAFANTRGVSLATETIDVPPGDIRTFVYAPRIGATTRLTLLAHVVSLNASCTAFTASLQVVDTKTNHDVSIVAVGDSIG